MRAPLIESYGGQGRKYLEVTRLKYVVVKMWDQVPKRVGHLVENDVDILHEERIHLVGINYIDI